MKILMTSIFFNPHIGGIETITECLADEFVRQGYKVKIITTTTEKSNKKFTYEVLRAPSPIQLWNAYKWCDIFIHQGISLKWIWPLALKRKPWFVVYHQTGFQKGILGWIKRALVKFQYTIAVSNESANGYKLKAPIIIHNSYNDKIFYLTNKSIRKDFIFVGRLNKDKGAYILLDAFDIFKEETNSSYSLTIVGDSPERNEIEKYAKGKKHSKNIYFLGSKQPEEIAKLLNLHDILIVPSTFPYHEAFGIVVLEGMACGCQIIGSDGDGISEAINNAGFTFENGNAYALSETMKKVVNLSLSERKIYQNRQKIWTEKQSLRNVAERYLNIFKTIINEESSK